MSDKQLLADALREYPTWGHAYLAERERGIEAQTLLLDVEGSLLAYWTDIPQAEVQRLTIRIREFLGDFEPETVAGGAAAPEDTA